MTADELSRWIDEGRVVVLDVRTHAEYAGEAGYPCDPRQGHIPGAVHLDWEELYSSPGAPLGREELLSLLRERGLEPAGKRIVAYCHSGQRSAIACVALRSAGLEAENYDGSWHEWSRRQPA